MNKNFLGTFVLVAGVAICGASLAHDDATGIVKKRMDAMSDIGDQMKTIASMLKGEKQFDAGSLAASATTIADHARKIPHLFPEGSLKKPSEALPAVWFAASRLWLLLTWLPLLAAVSVRCWRVMVWLCVVGVECCQCSVCVCVLVCGVVSVVWVAVHLLVVAAVVGC